MPTNVICISSARRRMASRSLAAQAGGIGITAMPLASTFATAYAAYMCYDDPDIVTGDDKESAVNEWCRGQVAAVEHLAAAPTLTTAELAVKLTAAMEWFDYGGGDEFIGRPEAELLRSCLRDLKAMVARA